MKSELTEIDSSPHHFFLCKYFCSPRDLIQMLTLRTCYYLHLSSRLSRFLSLGNHSPCFLYTTMLILAILLSLYLPLQPLRSELRLRHPKWSSGAGNWIAGLLDRILGMAVVSSTQVGRALSFSFVVSVRASMRIGFNLYVVAC
jgi:hypothetical protein